MKEATIVIKRLLRTEKGSLLSEKAGKYSFQVDLSANKIDIKKAVEVLYKVKVKGVNTQCVSGKPKTMRRNLGYTPDWKKAIVTLKSGQKIDLAQG